ncbi:MAG: S1 RNA-binding domain-containing protein [Armatimonadota bacterium]
MPLEVGSIVSGSVTRLLEHGALVALPEGKSGLVHISEITDAFVHDVADYLRVGDSVTVKVININDRGRYELSAKQVEALKPIDPEAVAQRRPRPRPRRPSAEFEQRLTDFMKSSQQRLAELKRSRDPKRRGRRKR